MTFDGSPSASQLELLEGPSYVFFFQKNLNMMLFETKYIRKQTSSSYGSFELTCDLQLPVSFTNTHFGEHRFWGASAKLSGELLPNCRALCPKISATLNHSKFAIRT